MRDGAAIKAALGGHNHARYWTFRCPCHDDRTASAAIRKRDGLITCFAGCDRIEVATMLDRLGFTDDGKVSRRIADDPHKPDPVIITAWEKYASPIAGTAGEFYLRSRGITSLGNGALKFMARRRRPRTPDSPGPEAADCMMAAVMEGKTIVGVQCTYLTPEGRRDIRRNSTLFRGAVRLADPADNEIGLAEGIETALSATQLTGVPCWSAVACTRLDAVRLPRGIRRVHLFGDNDDAGRKAVQRAIKQYTARGLHVRVWWPPAHLNDFNDVLTERAAA